MNYKVGKNPCPRCREEGRDTSGDNFHWYGEGRGGYCFVCNYAEPSKDSGEFSEKRDRAFPPVDLSKRITKEQLDEIKEYTVTDGVTYRGIRPEVSKFFNIRYELDENGNVLAQYYPTTYDYRLSGYKVRWEPKDFEGVGLTGQHCELFGQWKFKTHTHTLLIVGGELDQLSAYQILADAQRDKKYDPVAVVSSTIGEAGAHKQLRLQYEWVNQFKKIVICMDSDEAGLKAEEKILKVVPENKVFLMRMRYKDANSYIWDKERGIPLNKTHEFINDFWTAKPFVPNGVKSVADAFDEVPEELTKPRITLPPFMYKMQDMMGGGVIQGRILNIIADTSTGKSSVVNRMVYHWIFNSPVTPTIVSLEATAAQYVLEMLSIHLQENLLWKHSGEEILNFLETDEGKKAKKDLCFKEDGTPRFYIIDDRSGDIKALEEQMELLWRKYECKLFVIDVLTDLLRGSSEQHAEDHMAWQKAMVKNGITICNVMHTRKPPQSADGKPRKVSEYDALGTGSFVQSAAYNIVLNRDKLAEDIVERNTTEVELAKCRGGKTGPAGKWYYDFASAQCYDLDDYLEGLSTEVGF